MGAGEGELFFGRGAGDDARAHDLADLDCGEAGAARGAEHDERLAGFELAALPQAIKRGGIGHGEAGGAVEIEIVRKLHQLLGAGGEAFARRAPAGGAHHAVAGSKIRHAFADAVDDAGEFRSR